LQIELEDSLQKLRVELVLEAFGGIQPNLCPFCPQPFLENWSSPNHAFGEVPSQEFSGKTMIEHESD
jgi:hypothetical protein